MKITRGVVLKYAERYDAKRTSDDEETEAAEKRRLKRDRFLLLKNLIAIGKWKSPLGAHWCEENTKASVKRITQNAFRDSDERTRIESLLGAKGGLRGVGYPVASVILHFAFPHKYPIMDFRVINSLGWNKPSTYTFDFWQRYCSELRSIAKRCGVTLREVDKALWQYDKEQTKSARCACKKGDSDRT